MEFVVPDFTDDLPSVCPASEFLFAKLNLLVVLAVPPFIKELSSCCLVIILDSISVTV